MQRKVKIVIIVLAVLLTISVLSLAGVLLAGYFSPSDPATVVVPDNLIGSEATDPSQSGDPVSSEPTSGTGDETTPDATEPQETEATEAPEATEEAEATESTKAPATPAPTAGQTSNGNLAEALYLYQREPEDNTPFQATNMFPGDIETKYFCVRVRYKADVTVRFHADIRPGYEKLAEVLKCRVVLLTTGETLYDGLMRDMPESVNHPLSTQESTTSDLYYAITAYLDTSVGNDYQNKQLVADFRWWVEETENLEPPPKTGDAPIWPFAVVAVLSLVLIIVLLLLKKRKEDADDEK